VFRLEESHTDLARNIWAIARSHGAVPERDRAQEVQVAIAALPDTETWASGEPFAEARVAAALAAGGRMIHDGDAPEGWILADSAGNRVCIAAWPDGGSSERTGPQ
jgi:4a-hydroxytetrahydrobiopterin dehydratase